MKRNFLPRQLKPLLIILAILVAGLTAFSQENQPWSQNTSPLPPPTGFVNDYAGVIDPATKQALETKLKNLKDTTNPSVEIAVAVVKTTGERAIFDYSLAVARGWKIGSVDDDNPSALLFIAIDDRKYLTQVSKDLEDELPDGVVGSLQRQFLVPEFKKANYAKGISDTIDAYIATIRNKGNTSGNSNTVRQPSSDSGSGGAFFGLFCCAGIILIVIVILIASRGNKGGPSASDRNRWGGGGFGGGGRSSSGGDIASAVIGGIIGAALSGGSSSSSSDSGSSSGGDWGGFGGGGDFGGGGAGGDW
ncbi:MAG TPA: TPM domain-containing protein [Pyrinomonadaceae bacterium]|nr:TPM domain-containing protein [Pyrinomonadaceae bacterium]